MKKLLFIFSLFIASLTVNAQTNEHSSFTQVSSDFVDDYIYRSRDTVNDISYCIRLFKKEGVYKIYFENHNSHKRYSYRRILLSSGSFKRKGKYLYFRDTATNLKMKAKVKSMEFIEGYRPLENKKFVSYRPQCSDYDWTSLILSDYCLVERTRDRMYFCNITATVEPMVYYGPYGYQLHLNDGTFIYGYYDNNSITILEGSWSQKNNLIILHDKYTGHDFYLINEEPNLRPMLIPGYSMPEYYEKPYKYSSNDGLMGTLFPHPHIELLMRTPPEF